MSTYQLSQHSIFTREPALTAVQVQKKDLCAEPTHLPGCRCEGDTNSDLSGSMPGLVDNTPSPSGSESEAESEVGDEKHVEKDYSGKRNKGRITHAQGEQNTLAVSVSTAKKANPVTNVAGTSEQDKDDEKATAPSSTRGNSGGVVHKIASQMGEHR
ncbi:hypothetical protein C8R47DRAFT_1108760 [Mycena vitilis]|nr:hypothetical protein C8R47DRAFT_1108760 [Mycena vitilis]